MKVFGSDFLRLIYTFLTLCIMLLLPGVIKARLLGPSTPQTYFWLHRQIYTGFFCDQFQISYKLYLCDELLTQSKQLLNLDRRWMSVYFPSPWAAWLVVFISRGHYPTRVHLGFGRRLWKWQSQFFSVLHIPSLQINWHLY